MLTADRLREILNYDPESGVFTRLASSGGSRAGSIAGTLDSAGYAVISVDGVQHKAHRLAFLARTGALPVGDVDHVNRAPGDNRWVNLRAASRAENVANSGARRNSKSGIRGVCLTKKGWKAQIKVAGHNNHIGYFGSAEAAGRAYADAAARHFGEFAA